MDVICHKYASVVHTVQNGKGNHSITSSDHGKVIRWAFLLS